ncbi:PepSY domain-containing protein [Proteiniclasticum sp. SCR006]|uniref:PepSY domain-containing protein n=1 Tax=Proteiniclasticum aestuarii TaxID=2817862 RepID=A0A939HDJ1_9CLOT|nr:PepSY domain-containing protein [Proteiniclasticum aestuarii]MBO1265580.1 PepSY domain-containing protein [Proteiniclasticum aestuarii]
MNEKNINERIKSIVDDAPIDLLDQIKEKPVARMMRYDEITSQKKPKTLVEKLIPLAAAAILLVMFGTWQHQYLAADTEIYMDINPSIEIVTNRKSQVIDIKAGNMEGEDLIENLSYKGKDYLEVTGELLDELILSGYLGEARELLLLSVYNKDMEKETSQLSELDTYIHNYLRERGIDPVVLGQKIEKTNSIEDYAREYGVSLSKMTFIRNLMILHSDLQVEELVKMSIRDLLKLSRNLGIDLEGIIESQDWEKIDEEVNPEMDDDLDDQDDDDEEDEMEPARTRLTLEEARRIALGRVNGTIMEEDTDDDSYDFEIRLNGRKYEIEVHAYSGVIEDFDVEDLEENNDDEDEDDSASDDEEDDDEEEDDDDEEDDD